MPNCVTGCDNPVSVLSLLGLLGYDTSTGAEMSRHPITVMIHALRLDWTGNSGESYIDVINFLVKETTVTTISTSANGNGKIISGGSRDDRRQTLSLSQARKLYQRCLNEGYKPVDQIPELTH